VSQSRPVRMDCDGIAPYYEVLEHLSFGKRLEERRFAFLGETGAVQRAIICGGGDGRFLARLLRLNLRVQVDFIELSPKMVEIAERRIASMGRAFRKRVRFCVGDIREFEPRTRGYDLIVTHFFLDCFTGPQLTNVIDLLAQWGTPQARWIVSDFAEANGAIGRTWTRVVIRSLYAAFRLTTGLRVTRLPNYGAELARRGYHLLCEEKALRGLLHSSVWKACPATPASPCVAHWQ
jgi:SAM-dependent methyltransferase